MHSIYQEGRDVYKFAVKGMAGITAEIVEKNGFTGADVDLFVPHQANIRIIEAAQRRVGLEDRQVCITIDRFGNTTSASIPSALRVALDEGRSEGRPSGCPVRLRRGIHLGFDAPALDRTLGI